MEEKEAFGRYDSIRAFFGFRRASKFVFRKSNTQASIGFTLIELLVVVAILGILAVGVMVLLNPVAQIQKARDAQRKSDLAQIQKVLEAYYNDNGRYPLSTGVQGTWANCLITSPDTYTQYRIAAPLGTNCIDWGTSWVAYNTSLPKDPLSTNKYVYNVSSDGQTYYLYAHLERGYRDKQNCCPANEQTDTCSCPHAKGGDGWDPDGDIYGSGDACNQIINGLGDWWNPHATQVCTYGVSSPNTKP